MKRLALRNGRGRTVTLTSDPTQDVTDRYGRLLAYVNGQGKDYGERIIRAGWAMAHVYRDPFQRLALFTAAQRTAESMGVGVWRKCSDDFHRSRSVAARAAAAQRPVLEGTWTTRYTVMRSRGFRRPPGFTYSRTWEFDRRCNETTCRITLLDERTDGSIDRISLHRRGGVYVGRKRTSTTCGAARVPARTTVRLSVTSVAEVDGARMAEVVKGRLRFVAGPSRRCGTAFETSRVRATRDDLPEESPSDGAAVAVARAAFRPSGPITIAAATAKRCRRVRDVIPGAGTNDAINIRAWGTTCGVARSLPRPFIREMRAGEDGVIGAWRCVPVEGSANWATRCRTAGGKRVT
jgi:hypothetical protein